MVDPYYDPGGIVIYNADCRDVLPEVDPASVDLLLTDPPYGIGYDPGAEFSRTGGKSWHSVIHNGQSVVGDSEPFDPSELLRFGRCVLFGANNYADKLPVSPSWLVWNRDSGGSNTADAELAWTNLGGTVRMFTHLWTGLCRQSEIGSHLHPTQKPVSLMRWIVEKWTEPGDLVFDPYLGSGPVARACADLGRRYIGVEIVEEYCRAAVDRLGQMALVLDG